MNAPRTVALVLALGPAGWAQDEGQTQASRFARIAVAEVQLRCFASARSPLFEDRLVEGQVVQIGEAAGEYRQVVVPLGPTGWVHKKFAGEPKDGMLEAAAANVSFRYRPQGSEAPVLLMSGGTKLFCIAEQGEWWKVRLPDAPAFVHEADLQVFDAPNPTLEASYAELDAVRRAQWTDAQTARAAVVAAEAELTRQRSAIDELAATFAAVAAKPIEEQDYAEVAAGVERLQQELPPDSAELARVAELRGEIERQQMYVRALRTVAAPVPTRDVTGEILRPEVEDGLARFDAVGWLRHERPMRGPERFTLEKGGRLMFVVTCASERYDLSLFDGVEVGISGSKSRPDANSVRLLDALKIEVLQVDR